MYSRRSPSVSPTFYRSASPASERPPFDAVHRNRRACHFQRSGAQHQPPRENAQVSAGAVLLISDTVPRWVSKPAEAEDLRKRWPNVGETELLELKKYGPTSSALQSAADLVHKAKDEGVGRCTKPFYENNEKGNNIMLARPEIGSIRPWRIPGRFIAASGWPRRERVLEQIAVRVGRARIGVRPILWKLKGG
jgi:hypothetical protein